MMNKKFSKKLSFLVFLLLLLDVFVWKYVVSENFDSLEIHFLDVGQGDSALLILPGRIKVLIDGGPDMKVIKRLEAILPFFDREIDLMVLSHAQQDHFSGLIDVAQRYRIGAFLSNGLKAESERYEFFEKQLAESRIPSIILREGDLIRYGDSQFRVLFPSLEFKGKDLNKSSLVLRFSSAGLSSLFTGDIGFAEERKILAEQDIKTDILKVAHHGSKYSSDEKFLKAASPVLAVIEAGESNRYGHPSPEVLERLEKTGAKIFRTDKDGTISIIPEKGRLKIIKDL